MNDIERVCEELNQLGYAPERMQPPGAPCELVVVDYRVMVSPRTGQEFRMGIGFSDTGYPEYPPHFICIETLNDPKIPVHSTFIHNGAEWKVFSAPPQDIWDALGTSEKNMKNYFQSHIHRFWSQL